MAALVGRRAVLRILGGADARPGQIPDSAATPSAGRRSRYADQRSPDAGGDAQVEARRCTRKPEA